MTHQHPEAQQYAEAAPELELELVNAPKVCQEGDHDFEIIDDSFDHEYGTERMVYQRCKVCGFESSEPEPSDDGVLYDLGNGR